MVVAGFVEMEVFHLALDYLQDFFEIDLVDSVVNKAASDLETGTPHPDDYSEDFDSFVDPAFSSDLKLLVMHLLLEVVVQVGEGVEQDFDSLKEHLLGLRVGLV